MEPEGSLPHSQVPATCPCSQPDQSSSCPHPTSWRSILILSPNLHLGLPGVLFLSVFCTKPLYIPFLSPIRATCPAPLILLGLIYLLTAIGLSPSGSTHLHTNNAENNINYNRTTQIQTNVEGCGPCPVFASFTLTFALQLRKKHGKTSVRVRKTSVRLRKTIVRVQYTYYQNTHTLKNPHKHTH